MSDNLHKLPKKFIGRTLLDLSPEEVVEYRAWLNSLPPPPPKFKNNRYHFKSRYGDDRYLTLENGNWYYDFVDEYCRYGFNDDENCKRTYVMVDPSGGAYIGVGTKFRDIVSVLPEHDLQVIGFEIEGAELEKKRNKLLVTGAKQTIVDNKSRKELAHP